MNERSCSIFVNPHAVRWKRRAALCLCLAALLAPQSAQTGTSYEAQIGGFMTAVLHALITGEFAGRRPSQVDADLHRPACQPGDYDDLRIAAQDAIAFDAIRRRCKLATGTVDATGVHSSAHLPIGYCEILKTAFEKALVEQVYPAPHNVVTVKYKGSLFVGSGRDLARGAQIRATCLSDGSLRVSAPRRSR